MARVKSEAVREAILAAATTEFSQRGYVRTTISAIAKGAGTAPSNVYVYFTSKLEIALAIYEPWFKRQILELEERVADADTAEEKMRGLVKGLLSDIPADENGYTSMLVQALATAKPGDAYTPDLLLWAEGRIAKLICQSLPGAARGEGALLSTAHMLMLVFDGVALRRNLRQDIDRSDDMLKVFASFVLNEGGAQPPVSAQQTI